MTVLTARDGTAFKCVGFTDGGAPTSGSFVPGNWVIGSSDIFICVKGGTPGTWTGLGATDPGTYAAIPATPVVFTQTYSTTATTVPNATYAAPAVTQAAHTYPGSGNLFDAVAADLLINVRTDTLGNAVADIVVDLKSIAAEVNKGTTDSLATNAKLAALAVDVLELKKLINSLIDGQQAAAIAL